MAETDGIVEMTKGPLRVLTFLLLLPALLPTSIPVVSGISAASISLLGGTLSLIVSSDMVLNLDEEPRRRVSKSCISWKMLDTRKVTLS